MKEKYIQAIDTDYSYKLAKRMEQFKSNPVLGYRTAGSEAEFETGEMLFREMREIGLSNVHKDKINLDAWTFERAQMTVVDVNGEHHLFELGAYQTTFDTKGKKAFDLVYMGKGTEKDYQGQDVTGKLVLVDINQRDEWWINYPVYEAYLKGAAALIAVQESGYGEIDTAALNAQDIACVAEAAAFSISQVDAAIIKEALAESDDDCIQVEFDAKTTVTPDQYSYNIVGEIPGTEEPDSMILLSAHYDSYFSGFQDDNAAVAMLFGIAKALLQCGYQPRKTLVFCALAAEEWGIINSKYDWSTGAYQQVFKVHPDWAGKTIVNLNFELPAHAHDTKDGIRSTYEYVDFLEQFIQGIQVPEEAYPDGIQVLHPIQTWSDDFSIAISGIPSIVNDFSAGSFMETHYHSQFDNEAYYQEPVYRFHHELYGLLLMAYDQVTIAPLHFTTLFEHVRESLDQDLCQKAEARIDELKKKLSRAEEKSEKLYEYCKSVNLLYRTNLLETSIETESGKVTEPLNQNITADILQNGENAALTMETSSALQHFKDLQTILMKIFKREQDSFVRLNWHDEVVFPHEGVQFNLKQVRKALHYLKNGDARKALEELYQIDNNRYAFLFSREVFTYFTNYVLEQPADRLQWGAGRIIRHANLYEVVQQLKGKITGQDEDYSEQVAFLTQIRDNQSKYLRDDIEFMILTMDKILVLLEEGEHIVDLWKASSYTA